MFLSELEVIGSNRCYIPQIFLPIPVVKRFSFYPIPNINIGHDSCSQSRCQTHSYTQVSPLTAGLLTVPGAAWSKHSSWYRLCDLGYHSGWEPNEEKCMWQEHRFVYNQWYQYWIMTDQGFRFGKNFSGGKWYYDADSTWFRMKQLWEHIDLCHSPKFCSSPTL